MISADEPQPPAAAARFESLRAGFRAWLPGRVAWLVLASGAIGWGDYLIEQREPLALRSQSLLTWGVINKIEIVNLENAASAMGLFLVGALLWLAAGGARQYAAGSAPAPSPRPVQWKWTRPAFAVLGLLYTFLIVELALHSSAPFLAWLWVGVLCGVTSLFFVLDRNSQVSLSPGLSRIDLAWLAGLFALALIIGTFALREIPAILIGDEGTFWEAARAIASGQYKPSFFDLGVYTFPIASSIFQAAVMRVVGVNVFGWRFSSVLPAAAAVLPVYLLGREWFDRRVGVVAALLMTANPYFLAFARLGYNNSQALLPAALSIYLWVLAVRKSSLLYGWLAGFAALAGFYTYIAAWIGLVTIGLGTGLWWLMRRIDRRALLFHGGTVLLAVMLVAGPRIAFDMSGKTQDGLTFKLVESSFFYSFYGKAYYSTTDLYDVHPPIHLGQEDIFFEPEIYGELIYRGIVRTAVEVFDPLILTDRFMTSGFAGVLAPVFFVLGLAIAIRHWRQPRFNLALIWLSAGLMLLSALNAFPPSATHAVSVIPVLALLAGLGLVSAADQLTAWARGGLGTAARGSLILLAAGAGLTLGLQRYFVHLPDQYRPNFQDVASWIAWQNQKPLDILYVQEGGNPPPAKYAVDSGMSSDSFQQLTPSDFSNLRAYDGGGRALLILFPADPDGSILAHARQLLGEGARVQEYFDQNHALTGYAVTNAPVQLQPAYGLLEGLKSLMNAPLLALIGGLLLLAILCAVYRSPGPSGLPALRFSISDEGAGAAAATVLTLSLRLPGRRDAPDQSGRAQARRDESHGDEPGK
jgi:4-amino-4-deoxy-L-arabinose transferase-like glycosyltransferase